MPRGLLESPNTVLQKGKYLGIIRRPGDERCPLRSLFCCAATSRNKDWISAGSLLWGGGGKFWLLKSFR